MTIKPVLQQITWKVLHKKKHKGLQLAKNEVLSQISAYSNLNTLIEEFGLPEFEEELTTEQLCLKLLQAAAEIEHALLIEYLYTASSVKDSSIVDLIKSVAIQEMGHLITVQNLILFMGGQPYFGRPSNSISNDYNPFPFSLEPLTKSTLEKYLVAEMPLLNNLDPSTRQIMEGVLAESQNNQIIYLHRVGIIYSYLYWLFQTSDSDEGPWLMRPSPDFPKGKHVKAFDGIGTDRTNQANPIDPEWRFSHGRGMTFKTISDRNDALNAIYAIASQGEGLEPSDEANSHFEAFLSIYKKWNDTPAQSIINLPVNPTLDPNLSGHDNPNLVTDPLAILWIKLHTQSYNLLLQCLAGNLLVNRNDTAEKNKIRSTLIQWALEEMLGFLRPLESEIRKRPLKAGGDANVDPAGAVYAIILPPVGASLNSILVQLLDLSSQSDILLNDLISFPSLSTIAKLLVNGLKAQNLNRIDSIKNFQRQINSQL